MGVSQKNPIHLGAISCTSLCGIRCHKNDWGRDVVWVQTLTLICVQSGQRRNEQFAGSSRLSVADGCVCDAARRSVGEMEMTRGDSLQIMREYRGGNAYS